MNKLTVEKGGGSLSRNDSDPDLTVMPEVSYGRVALGQRHQRPAPVRPLPSCLLAYDRGLHYHSNPSFGHLVCDLCGFGQLPSLEAVILPLSYSVARPPLTTSSQFLL